MSGFAPDQLGADVRASPNCGERRDGKTVSILLLHYTGMASAQSAEDWLCDPRSEVSCHYIVHEDGRTVQMVPETSRAWHAGAGSWAGETDINSISVGIEIVNPGHDGGLPPFPVKQITAVVDLSLGIIARNRIRPERVLAHSDVAPGRKVDPGPRFPWSRLAGAGVGIAPRATPVTDGPVLKRGDTGKTVEALQSMLAGHGYGLPVTGEYDQRTETIVRAFQLHFRRACIDGVADRSTVRTLERLSMAIEGG